MVVAVMMMVRDGGGCDSVMVVVVIMIVRDGGGRDQYAINNS